MSNRIGFIGAGNMGGAMITSIAQSGIIPAENILVFDVDRDKLSVLREKTGITITDSALETVRKSDIIILAVKPTWLKQFLMI